MDAQAIAEELVRIDSKCPRCDGVVEVTSSGALTCREHGSGHYRYEPEGASR